MSPTVAAIDLGATSGRVLTGTLRDGRLELCEHARFPNAPVAIPTGDGEELVWDLPYLWQQIQTGLRAAATAGPVDAVAIDSWAVDYGLLDADGRLLANPACYRSPRTTTAIETVLQIAGADRLYAANGLQLQPFNTLFQLLADRDDPRRTGATRMLLLPDLLGYWLTGEQRCEVTNASTTGLLDPRTRAWSHDVLTLVREHCDTDLAPLLAELIEPGRVIGPITRPDLGLRTVSGESTPLIAVGSHDTASAVLGVPTDDANFAYISAGTWSLVGLELDRPILTAGARQANFTNELGVDGSVRFLKNVTGSWITEQCLSQWRAVEPLPGWNALDAEAASAEPLRTLFDVADPRFAAPGEMTARIDTAAREQGEPTPETRGQYLRAITESLALASQRAITQAAELAGLEPHRVQIVGGGSRNALLCQLIADATGLPVIAGPVEATAIGNILVQLRAIGALPGSRRELRRVIAASFETELYNPTPGAVKLWAAAAHRLDHGSH